MRNSKQGVMHRSTLVVSAETVNAVSLGGAASLQPHTRFVIKDHKKRHFSNVSSVWPRRCLMLCWALLFTWFSFIAKAQDLNQLEQVTPDFSSWVNVQNARITANGDYVVFITSQIGVRELFSIPVGGDESDIVRLNVDLVDRGDVGSFSLSPDGKTVVYLADAEVGGQAQVFSVPVIGGDSIPLSPDATSFRGRTARSPLVIDPSGEFVLFRLDFEAEGQFQLFRAAIDGSDTAALSQGDVFFRPLRFSPDSATVVFSTDLRVSDVFELFAVPLNGTSLDGVRLHPALNNSQDVAEAQISADGQSVVYRIDTDSDISFGRREELFSTPLNGSGSNSFTALVDGYPSAIGDLQDFAISPDGRTVVYTSDQRIDGTQELFKVSIDGGPATRLNDDVEGFDQVSRFALSPTGNRVVYRAKDNNEALFTVPLSGGFSQAEALESPFDDLNDVAGFIISGDGRNVIYEKRFDIDETIQLFVAPLTGGQTPKAISQIFGDPDEDEEGSLSAAIGGQHISYIPPDDRRIFSARIALPSDDNELCIPIKAQNDRVVLICL